MVRRRTWLLACGWDGQVHGVMDAATCARHPLLTIVPVRRTSRQPSCVSRSHGIHMRLEFGRPRLRLRSRPMSRSSRAYTQQPRHPSASHTASKTKGERHAKGEYCQPGQARLAGCIFSGPYGGDEARTCNSRASRDASVSVSRIRRNVCLTAREGQPRLSCSCRPRARARANTPKARRRQRQEQKRKHCALLPFSA